MVIDKKKWLCKDLLPFAAHINLLYHRLHVNQLLWELHYLPTERLAERCKQAITLSKFTSHYVSQNLWVVNNCLVNKQDKGNQTVKGEREKTKTEVGAGEKPMKKHCWQYTTKVFNKQTLSLIILFKFSFVQWFQYSVTFSKKLGHHVMHPCVARPNIVLHNSKEE